MASPRSLLFSLARPLRAPLWISAPIPYQFLHTTKTRFTPGRDTDAELVPRVQRSNSTNEPVFRKSWMRYKDIHAGVESGHYARMRKFNRKKNEDEKHALARKGRLNIAGAIEYIGTKHGSLASGGILHGAQSRLDVVAQEGRFRRIFNELCAVRRVNVDDAEASRATIHDFLAQKYEGNEPGLKLVVCVDLMGEGLGLVDAVVVESYFRFHKMSYTLIVGGEEWKVSYDGRGNPKEERPKEKPVYSDIDMGLV